MTERLKAPGHAQDPSSGGGLDRWLDREMTSWGETGRTIADNVPGQWHVETWTVVARTLEQEPGGAPYRGHHIVWVTTLQPGRWCHEVDGNLDWRFETLAAAMTFIDVLES